MHDPSSVCSLLTPPAPVAEGGSVNVTKNGESVNTRAHVEFLPALAGPYTGRMLARMEQPGVHVAVRVFSMTVLARIAAKEPDLGRELRLVIEHQTPYGSKGYCSRATRILKELAGEPPRPSPGRRAGIPTPGGS